VIPSRDLQNYLRAQPFEPFTIRLTSGRTYDIRHPEMVKVGKNTLIVFTYVNDHPEVFDRWETVSLLLIENVSHTQTQPASPGS
jgi:hypothetical protein